MAAPLFSANLPAMLTRPANLKLLQISIAKRNFVPNGVDAVSAAERF
jgi:hypothetical protein